jgi:hypothetical protein
MDETKDFTGMVVENHRWWYWIWWYNQWVKKVHEIEVLCFIILKSINKLNITKKYERVNLI